MNKQLLNLVSEMFNVPLTSKVLSTKNFLVLSIKPRFKKDQASLTKNGLLNTDFFVKRHSGKKFELFKRNTQEQILQCWICQNNWQQAAPCKFDILPHISSFLKIGIWLKFYLWRNLKVLPHSGKTFMWQKALHSLQHHKTWLSSKPL